ncbi:MAG: NAD(P)/FAD-dependent oxidoreductase [Alphaproteobacteria bacterium]|mgnify:CR=1 FL=1|nr:NAD(P)/FAD-dependent oxidoreductase [Alphaproteobacteria bacterium]
MFDVDAVVAGAGAVGLACAAALARRGDSVLVVEAAGAIGTGVSARNSEVVHAGMYYPNDSLRRRFCVEGRRLLYAYLAERGVAHKKLGKLIVATREDEIAQVEAIHVRGLSNGVEALEMISGAHARAMEPNLSCVAALWSPETGILDSHGYMLALQGEMEDAGGAIAFLAPVGRVSPHSAGGFRVSVGGEAPAEIQCRLFINSAGLQAQSVAQSIEGYDPALIPKLTLAKGSYFGCLGRAAFSRLIYPAPVEGGLGVHVTLDLGGRMRFGPDVEWLGDADPEAVDYQVDPSRADRFYAAVRKYWPGLPDGAITTDYSGCRPKLSGPGEPAADFRVDGPEVHGMAGLVQLFGIESPGLTSSPAIAEEVARRLA